MLTGWLRADPALVRAWSTSDRDAVTVWTHADHSAEATGEEDDLSGLLGEGAARRFIEAVAIADAREPLEPHHTFQIVATDPYRRRRGLGTTVVQPGLEWCDADHMPAYCWTADAAILPWLHTHGFRLVWTDQLPGGLTLFGAWREPCPH